MAKFGKFVGKEFKAFNENELKDLEKTINSVFGTIGKVKLERVDTSCTNSAVFKVALNKVIGKVYDNAHKGNYAYNISELIIMACKHEGQLEKSIGVYEGEPFIQYDLTCWTNGGYHEYRKHHKYDWKFEGKHHFAYDTDINDFEVDLQKWNNCVQKGIAY